MIPRKCHHKRVYARNVSDDSENKDAWLDILRIDEMSHLQNAGAQAADVRFKWEDDNDPSTNQRRKMKTLKVTSPVDDTVYFNVEIVQSIVTFDSDQRQVRTFNNTTDNTRRKVKKRRVTFKELDLPAKATWDVYMGLIAAGANEDKDQYIDVEFVQNFVTSQQQGFDYQRATNTLKNEKALELYSAADGEVVRLDPLQVIVNVQLNSIKVFVVSGSYKWPPSVLGGEGVTDDSDHWVYGIWLGGDVPNGYTGSPALTAPGFQANAPFEYYFYADNFEPFFPETVMPTYLTDIIMNSDTTYNISPFEPTAAYFKPGAEKAQLVGSPGFTPGSLSFGAWQYGGFAQFDFNAPDDNHFNITVKSSAISTGPRFYLRPEHFGMKDFHPTPGQFGYEPTFINFGPWWWDGNYSPSYQMARINQNVEPVEIGRFEFDASSSFVTYKGKTYTPRKISVNTGTYSVTYVRSDLNVSDLPFEI